VNDIQTEMPALLFEPIPTYYGVFGVDVGCEEEAIPITVSDDCGVFGLKFSEAVEKCFALFADVVADFGCELGLKLMGGEVRG
jgi:hypothetical protein